ncbi:MAG: hypothetical protein HQL54_13340 [Magnetococcales bacterium]|nr:hypothetical protein [Magnetococcales bacterium]
MATGESWRDRTILRANWHQHQLNMPRQLAMAVASIETMDRPEFIPEQMWQFFVDDCTNFASCWSRKAMEKECK